MLILERHPGWSHEQLQRTPQAYLDVEAALLSARQWHSQRPGDA